MHKPESVLENETHEILYDFVTQADHLIQAKNQNLMIVKKRKKRKKSAE